MLAAPVVSKPSSRCGVGDDTLAAIVAADDFLIRRRAAAHPAATFTTDSATLRVLAFGRLWVTDRVSAGCLAVEGHRPLAERFLHCFAVSPATAPPAAS
jgi:hypothetical protein